MGKKLKICLCSNERLLQEFSRKTAHIDRAELDRLIKCCQGDHILPPDIRSIPLVRLSDAEAALAERDAEIEQLRNQVKMLEAGRE